MMSENISPSMTIGNLLTNSPEKVKINIEFTKLPTGAISVSGVPKTKDQLILDKYAHLVGQGITISQAAKKYSVPRDAVENWVYQGKYIQFVDEISYPKQINEADVAICADIYKYRQMAGIKGVPFFDKDGLYIEKLMHPNLSIARRQKRAA
jgi:hypothetical protein